MGFEIPSDLMVSVSGVRGRVGEGLTPEVIARFAAAFGTYLRSTGNERPKVVLGRDSRTSGPLFTRVVTAALQSVGADVIDIGLAPTPTTLLSISQHDAAGAIVVTASHNPVEWNALKFASASGMFLDADEAREMWSYLSERPIPRATWDRLGKVSYDDGAVERHIEAVLGIPYLDLEGLRGRRFRVALDCIRGAGAVILPRLLEALGCEVIGLNLEPDGHFPREPEPVSENLGELGELVRQSGADIGLATDPDADRLSIVSETGRPIGEDLTLALAAKLVLGKRVEPVVTNLSTSRVLEDITTAAGATLYRAPVGEINVARRMEEVGAIIGGEGNGGVILPELHLTRDAMIAAALVLQFLLESGGTLEEELSELRSYSIVKDKLPRDAGPLEETYEILEADLGAPEVDKQDGLRLSWPDEMRWLHMRPSGTEPILRIIAEAPTEDGAQELVNAAREAIGN